MAGGGGSGDSDGMITDINVTPLVDIILVLLIVFMLTANLIQKQAIEMELPKAATGETTQPTVLAISLGRDGVLYLNGKQTDEAGLRAYLPDVAKKDSKAQAIIAADKAVAHGQVIHLIDLVRQAGIFKFALNIDPTPDAGAVP
jgi:biopolymer transport protein TolR